MEKHQYNESMEKLNLKEVESRTVSVDSAAQVVGSTDLYENGQIKLIPMPTPNPKDPLNLPQWRKWMAVASICFFGALALSAETIIGALVPVFVLEYAGIDPKILNNVDLSALGPPGVVNLNPLSALSGLGGPPLWKVTLLATLPLLTNGISSYFLVPLSISIGRRPVIIFCGIMAWSGGLWAGFSKSLESHIAARCLQALGAGAVEALIPLIVQDFMFIHQRNKAMSLIWATQGLIIVSIGINSPVIVATWGWRDLYFITSGLAIFAWLMVIAWVPETRWMRTEEELSGKAVYPMVPGENRPRLDSMTYGRRTLWTDIGVMNAGFENRAAGRSMVDTLRTMFFPNIFWVIVLNSIFISINGAIGQVGSAVLIAAGWKFRTLGLAVLPIVFATPVVFLLGGVLADKVSNRMAMRNGGRREPENHLLNLILPIFLGFIGVIMFGYAGQHIKTTHWSVLIIGIFFIATGFLTTNTVMSVYIVESYPQWAGPVLVNVSSFRLIVGFAMSFKATQWIEQLGFLRSFGIYAGVLALVSLFLPVMFFYGKRIREFTAGKVQVKHYGM